MTVEDIKTTVKILKRSYKRRKEFDGVEIHSSNVICFSSSLTEQLIIERMNTVEVLKTSPYLL
jgi:hypothetical protein